MGAGRSWPAWTISGLSIPAGGRGDREVGVAELPLDDEQWDSLARHLHGMGVPQLMGAKRQRTPARAAAWWRCERTPAAAHGRPAVRSRTTQNSAPTGRVVRRSSHGVSGARAHWPHPDLVALAALASAPGSRHDSDQGRCEPRRALHLCTARPARAPRSGPQADRIMVRGRAACMTAMISSAVGGLAG